MLACGENVFRLEEGFRPKARRYGERSGLPVVVGGAVAEGIPGVCEGSTPAIRRFNSSSSCRREGSRCTLSVLDFGEWDLLRYAGDLERDLQCEGDLRL